MASNPLRNQSTRAPVGGSSIAAYFRNPSDAETAIKELSSAGFSKKEIGVALREHGPDNAKSHSSVSGWADRLRSMFAPHERDEYESPDAMDVLDHMGVPDEEAKYYKNALRSGGVLITVNAGVRRAEAISILKRCHAITEENFRSQKLESRDTDLQEGRSRIELLGETLRINKARV